MNLLDVIKRPVITEKSMNAMEENKYTFEVDTRANKTLVKQAVEAAFDVKVKDVNIVNVRPKFKRMGKYAGYDVDVSMFSGIKIGNNDVYSDIKTVSLVGSTTKADLFFSIKPIKNYYQIQVKWRSGGESILEVNEKALKHFNWAVEFNN